jgi:hypothetical protein
VARLPNGAAKAYTEIYFTGVEREHANESMVVHPLSMARVTAP